MTKHRVVVTRKWPKEVQARLAALYDVKFNESDHPMTAGALKQAMQWADALLPTVTDAITSEIIEVAGKRTRIIGNFGVGYNHIDVAAAQKEGVVVTNTPDVLTDCTADIAMMLLLMSARRASEGERLVRNGQWQGWRPTQLLGGKVTGKTLGLIGFGRIAQAMAKKAHHGFGMKILFYTPRQAPAQNIVDPLQATRCAMLEELLASADFISLHCPGSAENRHLINEDRLKLMRTSAHLINTARGDVVDSAALCKALRQGWIAGAGLDVYEGEPKVDPGLIELDNVTLMPHLGSATEETRIAMGNRVVENLEAFFAGHEPVDRVA